MKLRVSLSEMFVWMITAYCMVTMCVLWLLLDVNPVYQVGYAHLIPEFLGMGWFGVAFGLRVKKRRVKSLRWFFLLVLPAYLAGLVLTVQAFTYFRIIVTLIIGSGLYAAMLGGVCLVLKCSSGYHLE